MQKALWLTALAFVATAVVTVTVAEYGQNHPNTAVGRLVRNLKGTTAPVGQPGSVALMGNPMIDLREMDDRAALRNLKILAMAKTDPDPGLRCRVDDFSDTISSPLTAVQTRGQGEDESFCSWCKETCLNWFSHRCCMAQLKLCDVSHKAGKISQVIVTSCAQEMCATVTAPPQECCPPPCGFWQFLEDDDADSDCKAKPCSQPKPCCAQTPYTTATPRMPPPRPEPTPCCQPNCCGMCQPTMPQPCCMPMQQPGCQTFFYRVGLPPMMPQPCCMPMQQPCCMPMQQPCCMPMQQPCCMPAPCCPPQGCGIMAPAMPQPCCMGMPCCQTNCCGVMQPNCCGNCQQMMVMRMMPCSPAMPPQGPMQDFVIFKPGCNIDNRMVQMMPCPAMIWANGAMQENVNVNRMMLVNMCQQPSSNNNMVWVVVANPQPMCQHCPAPSCVANPFMCPHCPAPCCAASPGMCPHCPAPCCAAAPAMAPMSPAPCRVVTPSGQFILAKPPCAGSCCQEERRVVVIQGQAETKCAPPCCQFKIATDGNTKDKAAKHGSFTIEIQFRIGSDDAKKSSVEKKCCEGRCEECAKYVELKAQMRKMLEACEKMESTGCKCSQGCKCCETPCTEKGKSEKPATCPGCCGEKKKPTSCSEPCDAETKTDPALRQAGFVGAATVTRIPMRLMSRIIPIGDLLDENMSEEKFVETCMKMVAPNTWQENGGYGQMVYDSPGRSLIVRQTPEVLQEVEEYITKIREQVKPPIQPDNKDEGTFWLPFFNIEEYISQKLQPMRLENPGQVPTILELVPVSPNDPSVPGFVPPPATPEKLPSCVLPASFVEAARKVQPAMETNANWFLQLLVPYYSLEQFPERK